MKFSKEIICFTGIDGSGKTTLSKYFQEHYKKEKKVYYLYGRVKPRFSKILMKLGNILLLKRETYYTDYKKVKNKKKTIFKNKIILYPYLFTMILDSIIEIKSKLRKIKDKDCIIVIDRYIYDTILTDIAIDADFTIEKVNKIIKICYLFIPKPSNVIMIDVEPKIAFKRKDDVPSLDYLIDRREMYICFMISNGYNIIYGDGPIEAIYDRVIKVVNQ